MTVKHKKTSTLNELHLQKLCPIFGVQFKKGRGSFIYLYRLNKNNDPSIIGAPI